LRRGAERAQRKRLTTALERLGRRYAWQEHDEAEYTSQRRDIERQKGALPLRGARPTFVIEGVSELVMRLLTA